jgi:polysulfide reductase chain C
MPWRKSMNEITWGILVVVYLFLAGLGAGSFCLGAIASKKKGEGWEACSRMAFLLAPFAIASGLLVLVLDLGYKTRFWRTLTVLNITSPMSVGVWLLSLFFVISLLSAISWLPASGRRRIPWIGRMSVWDLPKWKKGLGITGIPFALGVSVYTGVLLSATVIPLWRSVSLPLLFFISALSLGIEGGAILGMASLKKTSRDAMREPLQFLRRSYRLVLPVYLFAAIAFISILTALPASRPGGLDFIIGWSGLVWWVGVVGIGILVPLIIVMKMKKEQLSRTWILSSCLLIGDFLLRLVLILAGQGAM